MVAANGETVVPLHRHRFGANLTDSVRIPEIGPERLAIRDRGGPARVIEAVDGEIVTRQLVLRPASLGGRVLPDIERDILKIVVVERHEVVPLFAEETVTRELAAG